MEMFYTVCHISVVLLWNITKLHVQFCNSLHKGNEAKGTEKGVKEEEEAEEEEEEEAEEEEDEEEEEYQ